MARAPSVVLLDAYGTLVGLDRPADRLAALLARAGADLPRHVVDAALAAEMAYYRENLDRGRDDASLAELRRDCAAVLARGLGPAAPPLDELTDILVSSLRFTLLPDALPALDALAALGVRLAVVSNWDHGLPADLAALGVLDRFAVVAASAAVGAAKPDPAIFLWALERLGVEPGDALHCGDRPDRDCTGARAAGVPAVVVDRGGEHDGIACPRIASLAELPAFVSGRAPGR